MPSTRRISSSSDPKISSSLSSPQQIKGSKRKGKRMDESSTSKSKPCCECTRLKLKCSRGPWPCTKCYERGVASLCPDGQLSTRPYKKHRAENHSRISEAKGTDGVEGSSSSSSSSITTNTQKGRKGETAHLQAHVTSSALFDRTTTSTYLEEPVRFHAPPYDHSAGLPGQYRPSVLETSSPNSASSFHTRNINASQHGETNDLEDRGLLVFEQNGRHTYYGPQSHSFHLIRPQASQDHFISSQQEQQQQQQAHYNSQSGELGSSAVRFGSSIADRSSAADDALRDNIIDNPLSYMAIPGFGTPFDHTRMVLRLSRHLPDRKDAEHAFSVYRQNVCWLYDSVRSVSKLWEEFYGTETNSMERNGIQNLSSLHPHRLALLFSILCLGVLFDVGPDVNRDRLDALADNYYQRAWVALQCTNPTEMNTIEQVQTSHLLGHYLCNRQNGRGADSYFPIIAMAMRSAIALGLHREAQSWKLPTDELEERRQAYWEIFSLDSFRSLACGRPCNVQDCHVDTMFPSRRPEEEDLAPLFHSFKYQTARILNQSLDQSQRADVSYSTILDFDRSLRQLWARLPNQFRSLPFGHQTNEQSTIDHFAFVSNDKKDEEKRRGGIKELQLFLQGHTAVANISQSLLHLHRPWYVRALRQSRENGEDIMTTAYSRSVVAVSESSRSLIRVAQAVLDLTPTLGLAWNYFWQHCFNAGICQCLQILHNPSSVTTLGAWDDVRRTLLILTKARPDKSDVVWAGKIDLLQTLQKKAELAMIGSSNLQPFSSSSVEDNFPHAHLSFVGATTSLDQRSVGKRSAASETNSGRKNSQDGSEVDSFSIINNKESMWPPAAANTNTNTETAEVTSEDWFLSLTDSLAASLLDNNGEESRPIVPSNSISNKTGNRTRQAPQEQQQQYLKQQQHQQQQQPQPQLSPLVTNSMENGPIIGHHRTSLSSAEAAAGSSWNNLLTDLLKDGSDPDINFWLTLSQSHNA